MLVRPGSLTQLPSAFVMARLTHFKLCPFSRSVRLALSELDIRFDMVEEMPWAWRPAFLALNPAGDLPVLELGDGLTLAGAYAISEYLGELVRRAPPDERAGGFFPGSDEDRAEVRRLVDWFHRKLDAEVSREMLREKVEVRMRPELGGRAPDLELLRAVRANLRYHLSYIAYLADQRRWLAGDEMSFADLAAAAHLSCLDYLDEVPWEAWPAARDWYVRVKSRPSFRALLEDRVPGVVPPAHYGNLDF
jgi:glutathione S-transferase